MVQMEILLPTVDSRLLNNLLRDAAAIMIFSKLGGVIFLLVLKALKSVL